VRPAEEHNVETETRIAHMVELMLANEWRTGKTVKELAERWGIKPQTARLLSAEASRIVRTELLANISMGVVPSLERIMKKGRRGVMPGDLSAAVQAAKVLADMAGLNEQPKEAPTQSEQTLKVQFVAPERPKEKSE